MFSNSIPYRLYSLPRRIHCHFILRGISSASQSTPTHTATVYSPASRKHLAPLIKCIHPDFFTKASSNVQDTNLRCLQVLNELWDSVEILWGQTDTNMSSSSSSALRSVLITHPLKEAYSTKCYVKPQKREKVDGDTLHPNQSNIGIQSDDELCVLQIRIQVPSELCTKGSLLPAAKCRSALNRIFLQFGSIFRSDLLRLSDPWIDLASSTSASTNSPTSPSSSSPLSARELRRKILLRNQQRHAAAQSAAAAAASGNEAENVQNNGGGHDNGFYDGLNLDLTSASKEIDRRVFERNAQRMYRYAQASRVLAANMRADALASKSWRSADSNSLNEFDFDDEEDDEDTRHSSKGKRRERWSFLQLEVDAYIQGGNVLVRDLSLTEEIVAIRKLREFLIAYGPLLHFRVDYWKRAIIILHNSHKNAFKFNAKGHQEAQSSKAGMETNHARSEGGAHTNSTTGQSVKRGKGKRGKATVTPEDISPQKGYGATNSQGDEGNVIVEVPHDFIDYHLLEHLRVHLPMAHLTYTD